MRDLTKNPFLILGISADAEMTEIRQVAQRRLMEYRLEGGENSNEARRIETALEQLQDPVHRFTWGLYWPELTSPEAMRFRDDPILSTLAENPLQDGARAYEDLADAAPGEIRTHNIGVLTLLQAVAATSEAQKGTPDDISDDLACCELWRKAFQHLTPRKAIEEMSFRELQYEAKDYPGIKRGGEGVTIAALRSDVKQARLAHGVSAGVDPDKFWMRKKLWARALDDKRLSDARIQEIRARYASDLLAPTGAVVTTALLDGHAKVAQAYVQVIRGSGFDAEVIESTLSMVYQPLADRIERVVEGLSKRAEGASTKTDLARLLSEFERDALDDLELMIAVGDLPGYAEEHARDTAAELLRSIAITAWNEADDAALAERGLRLAERIADSESLRSKLGDDRTVLKEAARAKKHDDELNTLFARLERAMKSENRPEARRVLDRLIKITSGDMNTKLRVLRIGLGEEAPVVTRRPKTNNPGSNAGCMFFVGLVLLYRWLANGS